MKVKKCLKILGIIIAILIVLVLIHTIRNYVIITDLQSKVAEYSKSENYHTSVISQLKEGMTLTTNYYKKDNKELFIIERAEDNEKVKISMYNNGERIDRFIETSDSKKVTLNVANSMSAGIIDCLKTENNWQNFIYSVPAIITSTEYNGKKCYKITNFLSPYYLSDYNAKNNELYIEKETGLCLLNYTSTESKYNYEFNNVDDSIFHEPDISQYTLETDN